MCKPTTTIISKVEELMELRKMIEELQAEAESVTDEIKLFMGDEETMMAGSYKVTWKETVSRRVDTTALKKVLGDALDEYTKTITTRPFKVI
jgi:predicted phage-related endonuclease